MQQRALLLALNMAISNADLCGRPAPIESATRVHSGALRHQ